MRGVGSVTLLNGHARVLDRLRQYSPEDFGLPVIVIHEPLRRLQEGSEGENHARINVLRFKILPLAAEDVRAALDRLGTLIGGCEVLIAGQSIARDLNLVTHNTRELEDWEEK